MANEFIARNGLIAQNNSTVTGSLNVTGGITGSLLGTASYADEATSSSYATTASHALSAPPGGYDTQIQFNSGSVFGGSTDLVYNYISSSLAHGQSPTATGQYSHAEGGATQAIGQFSHAEGYGTQAIDEGSHAEGRLTQAIGPFSHAEGRSTQAIGQFSHTEGNDTTTGITTAYSSSVSSGLITLDTFYGDVTSLFIAGNTLILYDTPFDGLYAKAYFTIDTVSFNGTETEIQLTDNTVTTTTAYVGNISISVLNWTGNQTIPSDFSHAEGNETYTIGDFSHAEGSGTQAVNTYSHAEGDGARAIGDSSHAEGALTKAIGGGSHAEGRSTQAIGPFSHAEGQFTQAVGDYSHTEGFNTITSGSHQLAVGQYNIPITDQSAFIIGDGTAGIGNEHNLLVAASGAVTISGSLLVDGSITSTSLTSSLQGTASYADQALSSSFATSASYSLTASLLLGSIESASYASTASYILNAVSASYSSNTDLLDGKDSSTFATTGSNLFTNSQIISGSLQLNPTEDPGAINTTSSFFFVSSSGDNTEFNLHYRNNGALWETHWLEERTDTGLVWGGVLTFTGTTMSITPGAGLLVNHNASTSSHGDTVPTYVQFGPITASAAFITSSQVTYLLIDSDGSLIQQTIPFTPQQYNEKFPLGYIFCLTTSSISSYADARVTTYGQDEQQSQFIRAFGPLKVSGYDITAQSGSLKISIASGQAYRAGGFYSSNPDNPSIYDSSAVSTGSLVRVYRDPNVVGGFKATLNGGLPFTDIDPTMWDDGTGTLASVGASEWTIQRVFQGVVNNISYVYYGQNKYDSLNAAVQSITTEAFEESETSIIALPFIGYIICRGNTTNLGDTTNNKIINSGLFRNTAGSSGGGGVATTNLNDLADVNITSPNNGQALVYNAGLWENGTPLNATSASLANTASYVETAQTASYVLNAVSSSFASTSSYILQAVSASYALVTPPAGPNESIQFNDNGIISGSGGFTFNKTTNNITLNGNLSGSILTRGLRFGEVTSTPGTTQNDYSPTGWNDGDPNMATTINISSSTDIKITGLAGGTPERIAVLKNTSTSYLVILEDNSASSTAGNRFDFRNPIFLLPNGSVTLTYDNHSQRWEPIAASGGIGYGAFFNQQEEFLGSIGIWGSAVAGTGASVQASTYLQNTTEKPLGMWQADTGTTNTGRAHIGAVQATSVFPTLGQAICLTRLAVEALSNATERYQIFFGWHDAVGTTVVTDGVYWQYDDAASSAWQGATANNNVRTTTGAAGPTVDTNYIWLGIYVNSDWTRATYFYSTDSITWTIAGSQSTNLPTLARNTGFGVTINKTVGTTQRNISIDYLAHRYDITRG